MLSDLELARSQQLWDRTCREPDSISGRVYENVGLADPQAMMQAASAAQIVRLIGLPEGLYPLSQATIYLATAPKSNAVKRAYFAAAEDAAATARDPVPLHLRNAVTPLMKAEGYSRGYRYAHDDPAARGEMDCLPEALRGRVYYDPEPEDAEKS
jgi:putative ATPase